MTTACQGLYAEAENLGGQGGLSPPTFDKGGLSPPPPQKLEVVMKNVIAYAGCI